MRIIGLDPGLRHTGWGAIAVEGNRLRPLGHGTVDTAPKASLGARLVELRTGLARILAELAPDEAAVEETFVNKNPTSTLKLGMARGVVLLVPAEAGIPIAEYTPNHVKRSVVGTGHAAKEQVQHMVGRLLPGLGPISADAADALAVAICHAHHAQAARAGAALATAR